MISLSNSKLDLLAQCPHKFFRRYVLKEPDIIGGPLLIGRAIHKALEHNFLHKMAHEVDAPANEVASVYRDVFDQEADKKTFIDLENLTEDMIDWKGEDPKEVRAQGQKALLRYHKQHAPFITPASVEERMEMQLTSDVKFVGVADIITTSGLVIDFKTVGYAWNQEKVEASLQPSSYAMLIGGPINFDFHFITRSSKDAFGLSIRRTHRTSQDINWLRNVHIPLAVKLIEAQIWLRSPGTQCFSCPHRLTCGYRIGGA